jgi:hypothetical protein
MADADQASGKYMKQEPAQELVCRECHDLLLATVGVVSPEEGNARIASVHEAVVGDGHAMRVSS